jgi:hypothetical protein
MVKDVGYKGAVVTPSYPGLKNGLFTLKRIGIYRHDNIFRFKIKLSSLFKIMRENRLLWSIIRGLSR